MSGETLPASLRVWLRWHRFVAWFRRCPECGRRPYGRGDYMPRWEDDRVAQMLGIADKGCPDCGKGATS